MPDRCASSAALLDASTVGIVERLNTRVRCWQTKSEASARMSDDVLVASSNENKMSDGGRGRASLGVEVWKSSQKWSAQRSAVRSIAWLGLCHVRSSPALHQKNCVALEFTTTREFKFSVQLHKLVNPCVDLHRDFVANQRPRWNATICGSVAHDRRTTLNPWKSLPSAAADGCGNTILASARDGLGPLAGVEPVNVQNDSARRGNDR